MMEIANFLFGSGYSSVYCHEGSTSVQNSYVWERYNEGKSSILVVSLKSDAFYSFYDASYQDILLVDFPPSVQKYDDLVESLDYRLNVFISGDHKHLLPDLVDTITYYQPMSEWLKQKVAELSNKLAVPMKSKKILLCDTSVPISSLADVSSSMECNSEVWGKPASSP